MSMRNPNVDARGRGLLTAGLVLALMVSACGGSSSKSATTQPGATTKPGATTSGAGTTPAASAHVDLTVSGGLKLHIAGTKADCGATGVNLSVADYPEVGNTLSIVSFNGGPPEFKWTFDNTVIYTNTSTTAGATVTTHPFKVVLKGTKLVAAVAAGAPSKPGVTLTGSIACPG
jgi:hypothetical protein